MTRHDSDHRGFVVQSSSTCCSAHLRDAPLCKVVVCPRSAFEVAQYLPYRNIVGKLLRKADALLGLGQLKSNGYNGRRAGGLNEVKTSTTVQTRVPDLLRERYGLLVEPGRLLIKARSVKSRQIVIYFRVYWSGLRLNLAHASSLTSVRYLPGVVLILAVLAEGWTTIR